MGNKSKYIEMITKANQTLTEKNDILLAEVKRLQLENNELAYRCSKYLMEINQIKEGQCKNGHICRAFGNMLPLYSSIVAGELFNNLIENNSENTPK